MGMSMSLSLMLRRARFELCRIRGMFLGDEIPFLGIYGLAALAKCADSAFAFLSGLDPWHRDAGIDHVQEPLASHDPLLD